MRDLGARIVRFRDGFRWNQAELASRAGVDGSVLNRVEQRKTLDPTASFILRVATALGRSADVLLTGREATPPVAILSDLDVPRELVDATAREIAVRVVTLIPGQKPGDEQGRAKRPSVSRKARGTKRNSGKA